MTKSVKILGIETSCDDTGVAVYDSEQGITCDLLYSQIATHAPYGGVVPELASRDHIQQLLPLVDAVLTRSGTSPDGLSAVAYTAGPGLAGALMVGACVGRSLAYGWNVPAIAVHHMEAHMLAPLLEADGPSTPFVALLVSGGHTQFYWVKALGEYELLGETLDDAAGEAFDKTAKLLGLPYPGGPAIAALAAEGESGVFHFTRPMIDRPCVDLSFSGLKTQVRTLYHAESSAPNVRENIACAFQEAVVDTLAIKARRALEQTQCDTLVVAGGVSANDALRIKLRDMTASRNARVCYPRKEYCTDNGAMVAYAGYQHYIRGHFDDLAITVRPRWPLS